MQILITGGGGFIGSHTADILLDKGYAVRVFDNLDPQIHGPAREWPDYLNESVERIQGDVRDRNALSQALSGIDVVYHLAAATGTGQSMYHISDYIEVNVQGTAHLLDFLANESHQVKKLIVASSRAIYGEGAYLCQNCGIVAPDQRTASQLDARQWAGNCPQCASPVKAIPTPESKIPKPASIYAISKLTQEQMCLCFGDAYDLPVVVLRYYNVYGPRQSFTNPYTGIIINFLSRLFNNKVPEVYEDGKMTRDFVHVSDVAKANVMALEQDGANGRTINIGSGVSTSMHDLAELLCEIVAPGLRPKVVGIARVGDIRHCTADLALAREYLGYIPQVTIRNGLLSVIDDARQQPEIKDRSAVARQELAESGLLKSRKHAE